MGWKRRETQSGWHWTWQKQDVSYVMYTLLSECPPVPRWVLLRLEEWKNSLLVEAWEKEVTKLQAAVLTDPQLYEIHDSAADEIEKAPDWADSLVASSMDMLVSGLMSFRLSKSVKVGEIRYGWKCVSKREDE